MRRVLVVEDNEMNRDILARRLGRRGYTVLLAVEGREAIDKARNERPDVVLMDLGLPDIDGWEATRRLKEDAATCDIPVIVVSAHALEGTREGALAAGAAEFETKPIDIERLVGKIEAVLAVRQR